MSVAFLQSQVGSVYSLAEDLWSSMEQSLTLRVQIETVGCLGFYVQLSKATSSQCQTDPWASFQPFNDLVCSYSRIFFLCPLWNCSLCAFTSKRRLCNRQAEGKRVPFCSKSWTQNGCYLLTL